jgi:hypothetical protein
MSEDRLHLTTIINRKNVSHEENYQRTFWYIFLGENKDRYVLRLRIKHLRALSQILLYSGMSNKFSRKWKNFNLSYFI